MIGKHVLGKERDGKQEEFSFFQARQMDAPVLSALALGLLQR